MKAKDRQAVEFTMVLPGYNEEAAVTSAVDECRSALRDIFSKFEILLINDCSKDRTGDRMEEAAKVHSEVRVHHNKTNIGQGMSLVRGLREARGEIVMHNAFDLPFDPADARKIKEAMSDGTDVLIVERNDRISYSAYRELVSRTNVMLLRTLFQCPFDDYNFVQAYRRQVLYTIPSKTKAVGSVTPELIIRAYRHNFCLKSIKLPYHKRKIGESSIGYAQIFASLVDTLRLWSLLRSGN